GGGRRRRGGRGGAGAAAGEATGRGEDRDKRGDADDHRHDEAAVDLLVPGLMDRPLRVVQPVLLIAFGPGQALSSVLRSRAAEPVIGVAHATSVTRPNRKRLHGE